MGNNFKYTDRQVREDPELMAFAIGYAQDYEGDFDFLLEAKSYALANDSLPVGVARGVLNCARHDLRVAADLPEPTYPTDPPSQASITDIRSRRRKAKKRSQQCEDSRPHYPHYWYSGDEPWRNECAGVPWAINRSESVITEARIKAPFALAKGGSLLHTVSHGWFVWQPKYHDWGFVSVKLVVKLVCKYPSILRDPFLIESESIEGLFGVRRCTHCLEEE